MAMGVSWSNIDWPGTGRGRPAACAGAISTVAAPLLRRMPTAQFNGLLGSAALRGVGHRDSQVFLLSCLHLLLLDRVPPCKPKRGGMQRPAMPRPDSCMLFCTRAYTFRTYGFHSFPTGLPVATPDREPAAHEEVS